MSLLAHLETGETTVCRCWDVTRTDGTTMGFTDHDVDLEFDGVVYRAGTGLTARALLQTTGLSVDNTEALGALSDAAITEVDISAGRFDGAEITAWLVNWSSPEERQKQFRGTIGELRRAGGAFHAELRGLTEALNQPIGRVYQRPCGAVLGDGACRFDTEQPGFFLEAAVSEVSDAQVFVLAGLDAFAERWFERGQLTVLDGPATGLTGLIKTDRTPDQDAPREVTLWSPLGAEVAVGDTVRIEAGCDKRAETCRTKFDNFLNFRGFPDIPGDDWLMRAPKPAGQL